MKRVISDGVLILCPKLSYTRAVSDREASKSQICKRYERLQEWATRRHRRHRYRARNLPPCTDIEAITEYPTEVDNKMVDNTHPRRAERTELGMDFVHRGKQRRT